MISLGIRHSGFGWLALVFTERPASFLRDALIKRLAQVPVDWTSEDGPQRDDPQH